MHRANYPKRIWVPTARFVSVLVTWHVTLPVVTFESSHKVNRSYKIKDSRQTYLNNWYFHIQACRMTQSRFSTPDHIDRSDRNSTQSSFIMTSVNQNLLRSLMNPMIVAIDATSQKGVLAAKWWDVFLYCWYGGRWSRSRRRCPLGLSMKE